MQIVDFLGIVKAQDVNVLMQGIFVELVLNNLFQLILYFAKLVFIGKLVGYKKVANHFLFVNDIGGVFESQEQLLHRFHVHHVLVFYVLFVYRVNIGDVTFQLSILLFSHLVVVEF